MYGSTGVPDRKARKKSFVQFSANLRHGTIGLVRTYQDETGFKVEVWLIPVDAILLLWRDYSPSRLTVFSWVAFALMAELFNTALENSLRAILSESEAELRAKDPARYHMVKRSYDQAAVAITVVLVGSGIVIGWAIIWPR